MHPRIRKEQLKRHARVRKIMERTEATERALASDYVQQIRDVIKTYDADLRVEIVCRVSHQSQERNGNLHRIGRAMLDEADALGLMVCGIHLFVETGRTDKPRPKWIDALNAIGANNIKIVLLATTSRIGRPGDYHPINNPDAMLGRAEWEALMDEIKSKGIEKVATLASPGLTPKQDAGFLDALSQKGAKLIPEKKPGYRCEQKTAWRDLAGAMRRLGMSYRKIAEEIGKLSGIPISHAGVRKWLEK